MSNLDELLASLDDEEDAVLDDADAGQPISDAELNELLEEAACIADSPPKPVPSESSSDALPTPDLSPDRSSSQVNTVAENVVSPSDPACKPDAVPGRQKTNPKRRAQKAAVKKAVAIIAGPENPPDVQPPPPAHRPPTARRAVTQPLPEEATAPKAKRVPSWRDLVKQGKQFFGSLGEPRLQQAKQARAPPQAQASPVGPQMDTRSLYEQRIKNFEGDLRQNPIRLKGVSAFCFKYGSPEKPGMRSLAWKLVLGYLPPDRAQWDEVLESKRNLYFNFVKELITNPFQSLYGEAATEGDEKQSGIKGPCKAKLQTVNAIDDPLGVQVGSEWKEYFKDKELREEIRKDVKRTYASFHFFNKQVNASSQDLEAMRRARHTSKPKNQLSAQNVGDLFAGYEDPLADKPKQQTAASEDVPVAAEPESESKKPSHENGTVRCKPHTKADDIHHDVLTRILFIFAKLNPGIRYVQGMNELLAPIYYVYATDPEQKWNDWAEPDAFFCFSEIMSEIRDRFIRTMDTTSTGIISVVKQLNDLLHDVDLELWTHLQTSGVDPRFYSFRWLSLLLSQEFALPDVLRIWDSLFADPARFSFLVYVCCAMLCHIREDLLAGDFSANLKLLQHFPEHIDVQILLQRALDIRANRGGKSFMEDGPRLVTPVSID